MFDLPRLRSDVPSANRNEPAPTQHRTPPSAAERASSPAAAAGETLNSESRNAAAVGCSDWFAGVRHIQ
jgi:hypothetical protein